MADIVERLRRSYAVNPAQERRDAAAEIERLRAALEMIARGGLISPEWVAQEALTNA